MENDRASKGTSDSRVVYTMLMARMDNCPPATSRASTKAYCAARWAVRCHQDQPASGLAQRRSSSLSFSRSVMALP